MSMNEITGNHSSAPVRWGVLLPTFDALHTGQTPPVLEGARAAEALGFDGAWVGDHLRCKSPVIESTVALSAAAAVTERITLGFSVLLVGLRPPALLAKQLQALDALSGGRLVLGVGVGGEYPEEFEAAGVSVSRRGALVDDMLEVLPPLLLGQPVDHVGSALEVHSPALAPAMPRLPRLLVGGRRDAALRRVARAADGWLPMWLSPEVIAESSARVGELAAAEGRPAPSTTLLILVRVDDDLESSRRQAAMHVEGQYGMSLDAIERWAALGPPERVAEQLLAYVRAGVGEFILMPLGEDHLCQYERLAEVRALVADALAASALVR
jgi:alkanesulfonate monooxygenase SsuD/methylene tetrahydromethanopterin reductase-like flavin-dependent oxidoreductase (luciferase family)